MASRSCTRQVGAAESPGNMIRKPLILLPVLGTLALAAAGCATVGPDFEQPEVDLPSAWLDVERMALDTSAAELAEWWTVLDDPVLDALIGRAVANNNNLRIAGLRVLEAQARLGIALGNRYPQVQVATGDATAVGTSENVAGSTTDTDTVQVNLGASASWEIDFWGRFRRGIEAADAQLLASTASFDDLTVLVIAQVADTYALMRAAEEQLALARDSLAIQQRSYDIAEVLYRNGQNSELDALQAKTLLLGTEASIPSLEQTILQTRNVLAVLLGMAPMDMTELLGESGSLPDLPVSISYGVPADLLRQRPDVRAAEFGAMAQSAAVGVATADLYPSFSLNGFLGLSAVESDSSDADLFRSDSLTYSAGAGFVWPFLNYGRIRNNIRVQDARLQQALVAYRETVIQAAGEVENALAALYGTGRQDVLLAEGVETARRSADLSLLRYQEGFADYQRVLDSQQALFSQQQRYARNRGEVIRSLVSVYRSLGGGWQGRNADALIHEDDRRQMMERTHWGDLLDEPPASGNR